jgi:hypothetical protein
MQHPAFRMEIGATSPIIDKAIGNGVNVFATTDVYGGVSKSEEFLHDLLKPRRPGRVRTKFTIGSVTADEERRLAALHLRSDREYRSAFGGSECIAPRLANYDLYTNQPPALYVRSGARRPR